MANDKLEGSCHCGSVKWQFDGVPESSTACNCTICRLYGVLWIYDFEDEAIKVSGPTTIYTRDRQTIEFQFCPTCGYRARKTGQYGKRRIAVNVRLSGPESVAKLPIDHFEGLNSFADLPRDGRCVADYWF
jgi:hypothetical protein